MHDDRKYQGRTDEDQRLLALAFSADAEELTSEQRERLDALLLASVRGTVQEEAEEELEADAPGEELQPERHQETQPKRRHALLAAAAVVGAVVAFGAGALFHQSFAASPYLTPDEVRQSTGHEIAFPLEVRPPTEEGYDPSSLYLSAMIDDNPVWIATRGAGTETCSYVDLGDPELNVESCAMTTPPVSAIGVTPNDPRLAPQDKGQYILNVYENALPFVTFIPER